MKQQEQKVYSYHTFIMPFRWEGSHHTQVSMKDICEQMDLRKCWKKLDYSHITEEELGDINQDYRSLYAEKQYFHLYTQDAIYGGTNGIVSNYVFHLPGEEELVYSIQKNEDVYELPVKAIRLKIYNTGVALLSIECVNNQYSDWRSIKAVNDYGRRMNPPFLPENEAESICADKIAIHSSVDKTKEYFLFDIKKQIELFNDRKILSEKRIGDHILQLLNYRSEEGSSNEIKKFVADETEQTEPENIPICPVLDDRMYVMCLVNKNAGEIQENKDSLYEFIFVDTEGGISCPTNEMRDSLLKEHTYERWAVYGTLYGMTAHSFVACTDWQPNINSFLTQYYQICCIVLAQRASVLNFKDEIMELSFGIENRQKGIDVKHIIWLMELQERYVAYQNQMDFFEVSSQEQAIDIYEALRKSNMVEKENAVFKEQLDNIYNAANVNLDYGLNTGGFVFAIVALAMALPSYFNDGCSLQIADKYEWILYVGLGIIMLVAFTFIKTSRKWIAKRKK